MKKVPKVTKKSIENSRKKSTEIMEPLKSTFFNQEGVDSNFKNIWIL